MNRLKFLAAILISSTVTLPAFCQDLDYYGQVTHGHLSDQQASNAQSLQLDLQDLFAMALMHSEQIKIFSDTPLIRETAIVEADAAFDWTRYFNGVWEDTDEPVGSSLTVGGTASRFQDENLSLTAGTRRRLLNGVEIDVSQRLGHQDTNSTFFIPNDQGTARLAVNVTVPLLRGRGRVYNTSLQCLAKLDVRIANDEFFRQVQTHLLEVARAYWALHLERVAYYQRSQLIQSTKEIVDSINVRRELDASPVQLSSAQAALSSQESELIRAKAAIQNAEARLRALVNAPELDASHGLEIVPVQPLDTVFNQPVLVDEVESALQNRPEIRAATKEIKAAAIRLNMSKHETLPLLNLVTSGFLSGLQGDSDIGQAWVDQFSTGAPSYSVGVNYEIPLGNRAARARLQRRNLEKRQLERQFRLTVENIKVEVEVAVRELETAFQEIRAKEVSVNATAAEVNALAGRWREMINQDGSGSLTLESLLRARQRLTTAQFELTEAQLTYNLALVNLSVANGSLLEVENVSVARTSDGNLPTTVFSSNR